MWPPVTIPADHERVAKHLALLDVAAALVHVQVRAVDLDPGAGQPGGVRREIALGYLEPDA
jgi:hypothetical protein